MLSLIELQQHYKVDKAKQRMHDASIPWLNRNNPAAVEKMLANKKMILASKIVFFGKHMLKVHNYAEPVTTPEAFQESLPKEITLWRGGGGVYDPDHNHGRDWVSFTACPKRVETFSIYDGTRASRAIMLPKRPKFWVVELKVRLDDILLYLPLGYDEEVIMPVELARKAEVIRTEADTKAAA